MTKKFILKTILVGLGLVLIINVSILFINVMGIYKDTEVNSNILDKVEIKDDIDSVNDSKSILLKKIAQLKEENNDIKGWIRVEDTNIDYPVLQTNDNAFYLDHNYLKESSKRGSIFLDKDVDLNSSANYLIYGHRSKTKLMFEDLIKYANKDFYLQHPKIYFATLEEEAEYEIIAIFYARVYYQNENNVFRYYQYINLNTEEEFNNYVTEVKKASIYDIDIPVNYEDQLLTLSTCEYSKKNGRFVIVAKKVV